MAGPLAPILFDLDGTLADTLADIAASVNELRAAHGGPPVTAAAVREMVGDGVRVLLRRALAELMPDAGDDDPRWDDALALYRAHHLTQCVVHVQLYPGVGEHLQAWHVDDRPMAVVTNKPEGFARRILDHLGLSQWIRVLIGGDTLEIRKPRPEPLWAALDRLGTPRTPGVMVGDGLQDLRAGKAAGLQTVAALYGYRAPELLRAEGADEYWEWFGGGGKP
jgi:phosphoglycolate phosphatase